MSTATSYGGLVKPDVGTTPGTGDVFDPSAWHNPNMDVLDRLFAPAGGRALDVRTLCGPTGTVRSTFDRDGTSVAARAVPTASGTLFLVGIGLVKGDVVTNISVLPATAGATYTNSWFALYNSSRVNQAISASGGSTAPTANAAWTKAMTTPYTVTTSGLYYIGILAQATTIPTLYGIDQNVNLVTIPPVLQGASSTGLTTPVTTTPTAPTANTFRPYCWIT